jgi:RNA polymerase sigma-70 factor (ECF subfamily)
VRPLEGIVRRVSSPDRRARAYADFARRVAPRLKQALISRLGGDAGEEATAEALAWGWQHWDELDAMDNPAGYLYRVGTTRGLRHQRERPPLYPPVPDPVGNPEPWVEPGLPDALGRLSPMQRTAVMLVHGFGWSYRETARYLEISKGSVQEHVQRGMTKLRADLKVGSDV